MCIIGMIIAPKTPEVMVIYTMVAIVNIIVLIASLWVPHMILKRFKKLEEQEREGKTN